MPTLPTGPATRVLAACAALASLALMSADTGMDVQASGGARAVAGPGGVRAGMAASEGTGRRAQLNPPRDVYVVRMAPRGYAADPEATPEAITRAVEGASDYWSEQTRGAVSFRVASVSDWVASPSGCGDPSALWAEALELVPEAAGPHTHLVVVAPRAAGEESTGCDYGFGSLGVLDSGGSTYVTALHPELLAHELGHNLGLGHAGALECGTAQDGRYSAGAWQRGCVVREYDDLFDVMGYSGEGFGGGYLGVVGIDALGVDPEGIRVVREAESGVRVLPLSQVGRGVRGLRIEVPGEPVHYVEYRTAAGRDAGLARGPWRPATGVRILRLDPAKGAGGGLDGDGLELDATPGGRRYDRALPAGQRFSSASGRVQITVRGQDSSGATLDVEITGP